MSDEEGIKPRRRRDVSPEEYKQVVTEQFAELGRFVQEFEELVGAMRSECASLLPCRDLNDQRLLKVVLHHPAMTAMPIFECMRALYAESMALAAQSIAVAEAAATEEILRQATSSIQELVGRRNSLLHGSWFIGRHTSLDDISSMHMSKGKVTKDGLSYDSPVKNMQDLRGLRMKCAELRDIFGQLGGAFRWPSLTGQPGTRVLETFERVDNVWRLRKRLNSTVTGQ